MTLAAKPETDLHTSPEVVLWRATVEALVSSMTEKKALAFLRALSFVMEDRETLADVRPLRPKPSHWAEERAVRQAAEIFRSAAPVLWARVDRD